LDSFKTEVENPIVAKDITDLDYGWKTSCQNKSMIFSISHTFTNWKSKGILSRKLKRWTEQNWKS